MKKYIKYIPLLLLSIFFIIPLKVDARNVGINFYKNERFNYFYEQKYNTPFYNFLINTGENIYDFLGSYVNVEFSSSKNPIFIFYADELLNYLNTGKNFPSGTKYVLLLNYSNGYTSFNYKFNKNGYDYSFVNVNTTPDTILNSDGYWFFFDEYANFLDYAENHNGNRGGGCSLTDDIACSDINIKFNIDNRNDNADFTYLISKYYLGPKIYLNDVNDTIVVSDLYFSEEEHYLIDDSTEYSSFKSSIRKFFSNITSTNKTEYYDTIDTNLEYFKTNTILKNSEIGMPSFYNMVAKSDISNYVEIFGDNYNMFLLNLKNNSYFLVPKNNSNADYNIYYYNTDDSIVANVLIYDINTNTPIYLNNSISINPTVGDYYRFDLTSIKLNDDESNLSLGSSYMYYLYANSNKYPLYIYYDTNAYDLIKYTDSNVTILNPNTNENFVISSIDMNKNFIDFESKNPGSVLEEKTEINLRDFTSKVEDFVVGFSGVITSLFVMTGSLFTALPSEVQAVFYFILFSGLAILVWRLLKGGS